MARPLEKFPAEFEDLLTRQGRRLLAGSHPMAAALADPKCRFVCQAGLIDTAKTARLRGLLETQIEALLEKLEQPVLPETIWAMKRNYAELLPKTMRLRTAYLERKRERAWQAAEHIGLLMMMGSPSYHAFAQALAGRPLREKWGRQILCYGPGDYSGPHHDHHPEDAPARAGYVDLHISLVSPQVARHDLVYARAGHFSEIADVARDGLVSAYRLPFWHYTTPLQAKRGGEAKARRWVLLGTFLFAAPKNSGGI